MSRGGFSKLFGSNKQIICLQNPSVLSFELNRLFDLKLINHDFFFANLDTEARILTYVNTFSIKICNL